MNDKIALTLGELVYLREFCSSLVCNTTNSRTARRDAVVKLRDLFDLLCQGWSINTEKVVVVDEGETLEWVELVLYPPGQSVRTFSTEPN